MLTKILFCRAAIDEKAVLSLPELPQPKPAISEEEALDILRSFEADLKELQAKVEAASKRRCKFPDCCNIGLSMV